MAKAAGPGDPGNSGRAFGLLTRTIVGPCDGQDTGEMGGRRQRDQGCGGGRPEQGQGQELGSRFGTPGQASCQPVGVGDLDTGTVGGPRLCTGVALANGDSQAK